MADIRIRRDHDLGLARAREVAEKWVHDAASRFDMTSAAVPGTDGDTIAFKRSGVTGQLRVTADQFELTAQLGFLLSGFRAGIVAEIERNLDKLLASPGAGGH